MDNQITVQEEPQEEPQNHAAFTVLCVLLLGAALGFLMYRVANEPREIAGSPRASCGSAGDVFRQGIRGDEDRPRSHRTAAGYRRFRSAERNRELGRQ